MGKIKWKPGNMIYPLPAVMVSCGKDEEEHNIITVAWTGTICTNPPMTYISIKPERHSYEIIKRNKAFVINLTTEALLRATDYCGVRSGKNENKIKKMKLNLIQTEEVRAPLIEESPVNILCEVVEIKKLGSHDMFIAKILSVYVDEKLMDGQGKFHLDAAKLFAYSHGVYYSLGEKLGTFGYSVKKKPKTKSKQLKQKKRIQ
ncbi:MAG: flavin reductase family protein [Vallitaleaceae bacterium]|nr:flavin reductase family protein [Vallitaleaceae bacterium]